MTLIDRIISGLQILSRYKPTADITGTNACTFTLTAQELEFSEITNADRETLYNLGWRNDDKHPYQWRLLSEYGLSQEQRQAG